MCIRDRRVAEAAHEDEIARAILRHAGEALADTLLAGRRLLPEEPIVEMCIRDRPLAVMNRHGLVAGATGTGKTKTLQLMAEQLSANGVPVFLADIKGDLSGMAAPGTANDLSLIHI